MNNNIAGVLALYLASKLELLLASERFEGVKIPLSFGYNNDVFRLRSSRMLYML